MNTQDMLHRTSEYRFSGYQVPEVPRACRSARGRGPIRKSNHNHSFEILASVAGKLLENCDDSSHNNAGIVKKEHYTCDDIVLMKEVDEERLLSKKPLELGSSSEKTNEKQMPNFEFKPTSEGISPSEKLNYDERINYDERLPVLNRKKAFDDLPYFSDKVEGKVKGVPERKLDNERAKTRIRSIKDEITTGDPMKLEGKPPKLVGPKHDDVQESFPKDRKNHRPFTSHIANDQLVSRYDNESSLGMPIGTANKRIKKTFEAKDWIGVPDMKDCAYRSTDDKVERVYDDDERSCYTHDKSQKIYPFKKRKYLYHDSLAILNRKGAYISPDRRTDGKSSMSVGVSPSMASQQKGHKSNECNVKLSIESFKVPELFIDISTNATVGSLKRMVREAVTSILGEGLHVGILVQGKKVRDDNKTLIQTGISQENNRCHNLGFILEPKQSQTAKSPVVENESLLSRSRPQGLTRRSTYFASQQGTLNASSLHSFGKKSSGFDEIDPREAPTASSNSTTSESKALITVPNIGMEALAVVPLRRKSGHHEYAQRRIRRPFSVSEVEALVRAVEKLGTGRWRDVKFHAFDHAKHRTYVDLKDKWKTLVHTARISPQQRRGEPVPQELLDRVLAAQAYWLPRQSKHRED